LSEWFSFSFLQKHLLFTASLLRLFFPRHLENYLCEDKNSIKT
jgi:hypothetical protein